MRASEDSQHVNDLAVSGLDIDIVQCPAIGRLAATFGIEVRLVKLNIASIDGPSRRLEAVTHDFAALRLSVRFGSHRHE